MDLSKVKMVVTDMDGTLLNSKHEVSEKFLNQFKKLKENNILFVAASGRQYHSIVDKLHPIKNDILVIAENGAIAKDKDKELLQTGLDKNTILELLDLISTIDNVYPVLCGKKKAYISSNSEEFIMKFKEYYAEYALLENLKSYDDDILKIAIYHFESSETFIYPKVKHLESNLKVKISGENWLDLSHNDAHKGHALKKLQDMFNISSAETMVFGDFNNDLEMLALADFSFAMKNAHPNVTKAANYSTKSNDEYGVETILDLLLETKN
ncbi:MAG: HAD family hydrolase [Cellulophaga sp.]|uniref:HAD family hydrolase n=1 Tax=unclassified Cellulophaga TaxID=2634405 RepID=UPI0026E382E4|nr:MULTISPECIES: HAD family hydrolase [unclassified Cellulophaga]MDO6492462.1 HAD family hydrolase [Cellulophaga sp. 2_MG-2023]MDO6496038.1 HAD family hydrolase [Cellulophaga sp. 3_MG-2023]